MRRLLVLTLLLLAASPVMADDTARILVFGGTGRLGSDVAKALQKSNHSVTVFARATSDRRRLEGVEVDYVVGDVLDAASVDAAFNGRDFDVIVDALGRGSAGVEFYRTSAEHIAASAARFGVTQIILHGSVGAGDSAAAIGNRMQRLMAEKTAGENAVMASGVHYTIIRNSRLLGYGTPERSARLYEDQSVTGSVTREGLARLTAECVLNPDCYNKIYHAREDR